MKNNIYKIIGNTPIIKINYIYKGKKRISFFKAEWLNFSGSIKDRVAYQIIKDAVESGVLKEGQQIVEVTSGNMGISLAAVAKSFNRDVVVFMPKNMSKERKKLIQMYGAKLILTDNFESAFKQAKDYANKHNAFLARQFENYSNVLAHIQTAKEIFFSLKKELKGFVCGIGTSGTIMGAINYFNSNQFVLDSKTITEDNICNKIKIFGVEPYSSQIFSKGKIRGEHKIQGLADDFVPKLYNDEYVDKIYKVKDEDALAMSSKLAKTFGFSVGISSGANFLGCALSGINGVASVFVDDNKKYISTDLYGVKETPLVEQINLESFEIL
ncbi:MAG: cysteine synthase family protein [Clostridia bacterium]|nr:cysteine synthase family protein [Clostridia bacterium]